MATTLELIWYGVSFDTYTSLDTLDLYGDADGLDIAYNGLVLAVGDREAASVKQALTLRVDAADYDALANVLQIIDLWQKRVVDSRNTSDLNGVYLAMKIGDETNEYQAQVLSLDYALGDDLLNYSQAHISELMLVVERTAWEEMPPFTGTGGPGELVDLDSVGGMAQIDESVYGDLNARLVNVAIFPDAAINEVWLGWRSEQFGASANFVPVWSLHDAQSGSLDVDTSEEADATAYDGTRLTTTFANNATLIQRVCIQAQDISVGNFDDQLGHFGILLRARMSDANSEAHVRIGFGYSRNLNYTIYHPVWRSPARVTGTSYRLYDMQSVAFPPDKVLISATNLSISVQARRASGTGYLYLDCLGLVPLDEGAVHILVAYDLDENQLIRVTRSPAGKMTALVINGGYGLPDRETFDIAKPDGENWSLPANGTAPRLIAFGQASTVSTLATNLTVEYTFAQRYRLMRGAV